MNKIKMMTLMTLLLMATVSASVLADQISGKVTTWHKASQMAPPKEVAASGVTVIIGRNLNIEVSPSGADTIYGEVISKADTNKDGQFSIGVPAGNNYSMILWKKGHTPVSYTVNSPGTKNGQISQSERLIHATLLFRDKK